MISYAILTHNEGKYIKELINQIIKIKHPIDEIVIVDDYSEDPETVAILKELDDSGSIRLFKRHLNKKFASQKNYLNSKCQGKWIVNIDADEILSEELAESLHDLIDLNDPIDVIWVPRVNIVNGLTGEHIGKWNWTVDAKGRVNFPDYQLRIYKNSDSIKWSGDVHEVLIGYRTYSFLPADENFALIHVKDINRQENQNNFYNGIQ